MFFMPGNDDSCKRDSTPLIHALKAAANARDGHLRSLLRDSSEAPRRNLSPPCAPWRRNLDESIRCWLPLASMRGFIDDYVQTIERACGTSDDIVLPLLNSVCGRDVAPLGHEAVRSFFSSMYLLSIRARLNWPDAGNGDAPRERIDSMNSFAEKLGSIAANVSNERVFCLVCSGMERIRDFRVLSKYINYMLALSSHIRNGRNPDGPIRDLQMPAFHATFIAERSDGSNTKYLDGLLSKLLEKLNETILKNESGPPQESP